MTSVQDIVLNVARESAVRAARPFLKNTVVELRDKLETLTASGDSIQTAVTRLLILNYLLKHGLIGPIVQPLFVDPKLYSIKELASVLACLESQLDGHPLTVHGIMNNNVSGRLKELSYQIIREFQIIVSAVDIMLDQLLDYISTETESGQVIDTNLATNVNDSVNRLIVIVLEKISESASCITQQVTGAGRKTHVRYEGHVYCVRTDPSDKRKYFMSQRKRVYLDKIRGRYRYA
jgi:hypothetical protein